MKTTLTLKGTKELVKKLAKYSDKVHKGVQDQTQKFLLKVELEAKLAVVADLGGLRGFIKATPTSDKMGGVVGAYVHYAPYVEFGTGAKVKVPKGLEDYAMQFKGKGIRKVNLPARPFLFPSVEKNTKIYKDELKKLMKP
jgi:phage gpG-like protein